MNSEIGKPSELGKAVRRLRKEKRMGVRELSALSGVGSGTISRLETGQQDRVRDHNLGKLARAFGLTLDELRAHAGESPATAARPKMTLLDYLRTEGVLGPDEIDMIVKLHNYMARGHVKAR